ncbi:MAG: BspA family leucine-rich repeat surface protein [Lachnospiraceae bacterium]
MRKKILAGLMLLSMTASSFSTVGYVPVSAAGYEDDAVVITEETTSEEDETASDEEVAKTEQNVASKGSVIASGKYDTWSWSLDADGVLLIEGTDINKGDLSVWPWSSTYTSKIKEAKVTGSGSGSIGSMFSGCTVMTSLDLSEFDTTNVTDMSYLFWCCYELTDLNFGNFNTGSVTTMENMFGNCSGLTSLDVSSFDTSNVTNMGGVFWGCSGLTDLDVSNFDTSNVTSMYSMFYKCSKLTRLDVSNFNTANVINMSSVFSFCSSLSEVNIDNFDTGNATSISHLFFCCTSLTNVDISMLDTGNVTDMSYMFNGCTALTSVDVSGLDTSNVTNMTYMFSGCSSLTSLDISNFDASNVTSMSQMYFGCSGLTEIKSPYNITVYAELPRDVSWYDESGIGVSLMYKERSESVTYSTKVPFTYYTIHFDGNGATDGSISDMNSCLTGTTYILPKNEYVRKGYLFNGWNTVEDGSGNAYIDEAQVKNLTMVNGGVVTLYAQWKPITYKVAFNANGGTGNMSTMTGRTYGVPYNLTKNTFKRAGYTFLAWNTKKDGSGVYIKNNAAVKNLTSVNGKTVTLYACWKKVTVGQVTTPVLSNPAAGKLLVAYKPVTGAQGYLIQYSTNSSMKNSKTIATTGNKKTISGLVKGKTYYVRVVAFKMDSTGKKVYGKFSPIQKKKLFR